MHIMNTMNMNTMNPMMFNSGGVDDFNYYFNMPNT